MLPSAKDIVVAAAAFLVTGGLVAAALQSFADGGHPVDAQAVVPNEKPQIVAAARPSGAGRVHAFQDDRGRWCEYRKVMVYDPHHDERYYIDEKVCLGDTVQ